MIPIFNQVGEKAKDANGNIIYVKTLADDELADVLEPHITMGERNIPVWKYIEMYCAIEDRESNLHGFALNHSQIEEYKAMSKQYLEQGIIRMNIGKSRQMGATTLISAFLWTLALKPGTKVGIIADTEAKGIGILEKYKVFYANSPEPIYSDLKKAEAVNNSKELTFNFGKGQKTSFIVLVQGAGAGVSFHFNMIHESEVAVWDNIAITISKLEKTVSNADRRSVIVRETTARGHNHWEKLYTKGKFRDGTFRSIFVPWYWEPSYRTKYDGHPLNEYELKLRDEYKCDLDQIQFWYDAWHDVDCDYNELAAEYPSNDVEMFNSSAISIFPSDLIDKQRQVNDKRGYAHKGYFEFGVKTEGLRGPIEILNPHWVEDHNGVCTITECVPSSHPLFLCNDPAKGGSDYWAGHIFDNSDFRSIATYHREARRVEGDKACLQMLCLLTALQCGCFHDGKFDASLFSTQKAHELRAGVAGERNTTKILFDIAWRMGLRNIPRDKGEEGYHTGVDNRPTMIELGKQMFRDTQGAVIQDNETLKEMASFQWQKSGITKTEKAMAVGDEHDDLVMAYCGGCYMRTYFSTLVVEPKREARRKLAFDPFARNERPQEKYPIRWRAT